MWRMTWWAISGRPSALAAAAAAEETIGDRVSQTIQAAEICVSTAEKVKLEIERSAAEAAEVAVAAVAAAVARAVGQGR